MHGSKPWTADGSVGNSGKEGSKPFSMHYRHRENTKTLIMCNDIYEKIHKSKIYVEYMQI